MAKKSMSKYLYYFDADAIYGQYHDQCDLPNANRLIFGKVMTVGSHNDSQNKA